MQLRLRLRDLDPSLVVAVGCILTLVLVFLFVPSGETRDNGGLRILYYDPHYREYPNQTLISHLQFIVEQHGSHVELVLGEDATAEKLHYLMDYDIVIIYGHGARVNGTGAYVWTGEYWSEAKHKYTFVLPFWIYFNEIAIGLVEKGNKSLYYLALSPEWFARELPEKHEHKTIVVYIGCNTFDENLAKTLIKKGALAYIGTTDFVPPSIADELVLNITRILLLDKPLLEKLYTISKIEYVGVYTVLDFYQT